MKNLKKIVVIFITLSLFASANVFGSEKKFNLFKSYEGNVSKYQKDVYLEKRVDSFEMVVYALNITGKSGTDVRTYTLNNPKKSRLQGMCSIKSNQLRSEVGIAPATAQDCSDVIHSAYNAYRSGKMSRGNMMVVTEGALIVYNNNALRDKSNWNQDSLDKVFANFVKGDQTINLIVKGMINSGKIISAELQNSFVDFRPSAASYIATTGHVEGGIAVEKICSKKSGTNCRKVASANTNVPLRTLVGK